MVKKDKVHAIQLDTLLNTYSVKDITTVFSKIDNRLISLHKRSAEDFLQLNGGFKDIYYQSNQISKNVSEICSDFYTEENNSLYQVINTLYENLKVQFEILDYKIVVISNQFEKLSNQIRHIFFPVKNYSQNLMSLTYLMANLRVSLSYSNKNANKQLESTYVESEKLVNNIKTIIDDISSSLNQLSKIAKRSQENLKELKSYSEVKLEDLLPEIQSSISLIDKKNKENKNIIPQIKNKIDELSISNTEIVKKLQYQDIIKQKMEHIQKTHKDLINELEEFNVTTLENDKLNEKIKCFLRIRDISGLQATQLIQTNREYQSAIEVITDNFILIGDNIKNITEKGEKVYSYGKINYNRMFEKIDSYINKAYLYIDDYNRQTEILDEEINNIHKKYKESEILINSFRKYTQELEESLLESNKSINEVSVQEPEIKNANIQFTHLLNETKDNTNKLNSLFDNLSSLKKNIEGFANKTDRGLLGNTDFSEFKNLINSLKKSGKEIDAIIRRNKDDSKNVIRNIKKSISKIQYYDYFEKIIQEIISELNTINLKLKLNNDLKDDSKEENLEKLKQYYTMQTERYIHDKVAKGEDIEINFDINEDDEIEFF